MVRKVNKTEWEMIREAAEDDLYMFARIVCPERLYGDIHKKVFRHLQTEEFPNSLLLLPRAHMKSHCVAVWCAWWITKYPETTILYLSATSGLAEKQLYAIKNILTCDKYKLYWPDMLDPEEGKREKWTSTEICVDHPKRKAEGVRDSTVKAAGLTTNTTGFHADVIVPDDVVVPENAYTEDGRAKTASAMSQMASILNTGGIIKACGTRYHPADQYSIWKDQFIDDIDEDDNVIGKLPLWNIMEEKVEVNGVFLWPRGVRDDGKAFGFDRKELARICSMYTDRTQYYAQYYNDPNDPSSQRISSDDFQYYNPELIRQINGDFCFREKKLNIYAAIDFAYTTGKKSDYTAVVVIGIDSDENIYILDIARFKTNKISDYYDCVARLHMKWEFRKLRAEITAAQSMIVGDLKDKISESGLYISIDSFKPNRHQGSKQERMAAVLEPRYEDHKVWHYKGGHIPALEEELVLERPRHDDIKDCLASVIEISKPPSRRGEHQPRVSRTNFNSRFGGRNFRGG